MKLAIFKRMEHGLEWVREERYAGITGYVRISEYVDVAFPPLADEALRRAFVEACQAGDRPAAQVIREFMRDYVSESQTADPAQRTVRRGGAESESAHGRKKGDKNVE